MPKARRLDGLRKALAVVACVAAAACTRPPGPERTLNDVHSRLNLTRVAEYHEPETKDEIIALVRKAARSHRAISISGGQHAMGGQQFGDGTVHLNMARYNRVLKLDEDRGLVTVESGIQWPDLIEWLIAHQQGRERPWGIRQKQTGADRLSVGGALSANAHGRGLTFPPIVSDVESFELVDAQGKPRWCSRTEGPELFRLAIGGYGLFGVITEVTLRLAPRTKLERRVEIVSSQDVPKLVEQKIGAGSLYGDFQFKTDERADDFLQVGVLSFYRPVPDSTPIAGGQKELTEEQWNGLYRLAHLDKGKAFELYANYCGHRGRQEPVSSSHRRRSVDGRQLLLDLSPLGEEGPGARGVSAVSGVPEAEAPLRSGGALPERVVPPLQEDVRGRAGARVTAR